MIFNKMIFLNRSPKLTFSSQASFTLRTYNSSKNWDGILEYSTNAMTWSTWDGTLISSELHGGSYVIYMRGLNNTKINGSYYRGEFVLSGSSISCSGNIETLLDYIDVANGIHPKMANWCFAYLFYRSAPSLISAPELPATTLSDSCYRSMFSCCTSLVSAPKLPATTLASSCYQDMFDYCTALTSAADLPATTLAIYCYYGMFHYCESLVTAPDLPATTMQSYCYYYMFDGCKKLNNTPKLPATTLANDCYGYMFRNCSSLTQIPKLAATSLSDSCYYSMFEGCSKIKLSETQTSEYQYEYRLPTSGDGTKGINSLVGMFWRTGGTFSGNIALNTTYYTDHEPI